MMDEVKVWLSLCVGKKESKHLSKQEFWLILPGRNTPAGLFVADSRKRQYFCEVTAD